LHNYNLKWFYPYLKCLSSNEAFSPSTPTDSRRGKIKNYFTEKLENKRQDEGRCSDDFIFSYDFDAASLEMDLPPLTVSYNEKSGRCLQATKNIEAGETIFWEPPLVLTPKAGAGPICLDCFKSLPDTNWPVCNGCRCPKCNENCEGNEHSDMECKILAKIYGDKDLFGDVKIVKKLNIILTPLRTYIAMIKSPSIDQIIFSLQSNALERKKLSIGQFIQKHIVSVFEDYSELNFESDFVHHVCGIFDTNAFDVTVENHRQGRALLPLAALMNHSCTPNTQHWFLFGTLVVRACVPIRKGEIITNSYTQAFLGNKDRKGYLAMTKLFKCTCKRCQDPTELGSYISSILCQKCRTGLLTPVTNKTYSCGMCENSIPLSSAMTIVNVASGVVMTAEDMSSDVLHKTMQRLSAMIGPQHFTTVKLNFIYLRKVINNLGEAKEEDMIECLSKTEALMQLTDKIEPGATRTRGILLFYKLSITAELAKRIVSGSDDWKAEEEMDELFEECEFILKWDFLLEDAQKVSEKWRRVREIFLYDKNKLRNDPLV
ncbi:Protein msta, isoform A, partial [Armadillidium vulgare]